jgi:DNA modification methylase
MNYTLHCGDNREVLRTMADASVDSIVCDPPYELGFMGKHWDSTGIAYDVTLWTECLRVLKPGGHLIAFGGSRTYHRLAVAIEDAGFEIRDQIQWIYGSGFPKSLDVSKALDKQNKDSQLKRRLRFTAWVRSTGLTASQINKATGTFMGGHYTTHPSQPNIMTRQHLDAVRHLIGEVPDWVETEVDIRTTESEAWKAREVVTEKREDMFGEYEVDEVKPWSNSTSHFEPGKDHTKRTTLNITAPHLDLAKQWQGYGTALKPAHEPAVLARKPLCGTVADNVMTWGCGALNIDGCRISGAPWHRHDNGIGDSGMWAGKGQQHYAEQHPSGRWPANVIFDEDAAKALDEQSGGASRFFYVAKASKAEREAGLDSDGDRANHHPTVKPIELMRYLVRLVTPNGGTVLDPFMGSGSTGCAAMLEGMDFIGIDITPEYVEIARRRILHHANQNPMGLSI